MPKSHKEGNSKRLREILRILRRHKLLSGITPEKLRSVFEDLGPAFIKIGQMISMQPDILPEKYCNELAKLRTDVLPMGFDEVTGILAEYGEPLREVIENLEPVPLGSASIAQVHFTTLPDGTEAVVKVVRPGVFEAISQDILLMKRAVKLLHYVPSISDAVDFNAILDEIWAVARQETDLRIEAANAAEFRRNSESLAYIDCPQVYAAYEKVLVMEHINGIPVDDTNELLAHGYDLDEIAEKIATNYIHQIVDDGFFHADPHPGNVMIRGGKIVWIDLGMMGRISAKDRELIFGAIAAMAAKDPDKMAESLGRMWGENDSLDRGAFNADLEKLTVKYSTIDFENLDIKLLIEDFLTLLKTHHIGLPKNISMLLRGMVTAEGTVRILNPRLNIVKNITSYFKNDYVSSAFSKDGLEKAGKALFSNVQQLLKLPEQTSEVMRKLAQGSISTNKEFSLSRQTMSWAEKLINRLIVAWVFGMLVIGTSLMFVFNVPPLVGGIPILGICGFIGTILCGIWLIVAVVLRKHDT